MGAEQNIKTACFTSDLGMRKAQIKEIPAEKVKAPVSRVIQRNAVSQRLPATNSNKLLQKYNKYESKSVKAECAQKAKARKVAAKILLKKKTAVAVLESLHSDGIAPTPIVLLLDKIAAAVSPGKVVTAKELQDIAGTKPDSVSAKWWGEGFPALIDITGITVKKSKTERRFAELYELENRCFMLLGICQKTGDFAFSQFDRLGGKLVNDDPFTERAKDGTLIVHERPSQTSEGKEAARKVAQAQYLKRMSELEAKAMVLEEAEADSHGGYMEVLKTYKAAAAGIAVALLLIVAAVTENANKEINPILESNFSADEIVQDYGYLADE